MATVPNHKLSPQQPGIIALVSRADIRAGALLIQHRIHRTNRLPPRSPAYLFIGPEGAAYVLHDEHMVLQQWVRERLSWLVGVYDHRAGKNNALAPTIDGLIEDIAEHMGS